MLPFREYHLQQIFSILETDTGPLDLTISRYFRQHKAIGSKDRKSIAETLYYLVRWSGLLDYFIPETKNWDSRYEVSKQIDLPQTLEDETIPLHTRLSFPKDLLDLWIANYGETEAKRLALLSNERAPITLRINRLKITREAFLERFKEEIEMRPSLYSEDGIEVTKRISLFQLPAFEEGLFEMQDEASQLIAKLIEVRPKQKVLDFCSGSGGKSLAIAPSMNQTGVLYLHDIRSSILTQAKKRLKRAGIFNSQIIFSEDKKLKGLKGNMDWVLVDVPCSGSGTYRRNPDLKWKFSKEMLQELISLQREIFEKALAYMKPSGKIVFATCSLFKEENEEQVQYFLEKYPLHLEQKAFNSSNRYESMDGFFGVVFSWKQSDQTELKKN